MFNMFSGGALPRWSIFALGIMPYISASIILQLHARDLRRWNSCARKARAAPQDHAVHAIRTVPLSLFQALAAATALETQGVVLNPGFRSLRPPRPRS